MRTMWINNGKDESNVAPVKRLSFSLTFTNTPSIIYSRMHYFIKEVMFYLIFCGICHGISFKKDKEHSICNFTWLICAKAPY